MNQTGEGKPIGVIGSDEYGAAIATRLAASGLRVLYYAIAGSPYVAPAPRLELAPTPTDIAFECDITLAAVEDTESLRTLVLGSSSRMGLGAEMQPGSILVDLGARTPRELHALLGVLGTRGVALLDATLIGGPDAIADGRAKILLGGYPDSAAIATTTLSLLGSVEQTGPLGSAHAAAALMGHVEAAHAVAREEAIALGNACGLTQETVTRVLADETLPHGFNVVQLARRAELARLIARERGGGADVIDLAAAKRSRRATKTVDD
jgi:3-hydroxyisobutyrate dehydrogenase